MSYPRSPPPLSPDDWLTRGHSKTYSTNSSRSNGSRSQSLASASSRAYNAAQFEANARTYHTELKNYLRDLLAEEALNGPHPQRLAARQKLVKLSNLQFHELAMDVYDEVVRRNKNDKFLPFLPVKEEFHPKRNQARQKLATLPASRFQDLASDVYTELSRRYASLLDKDELPTNNSNQALPSKSTHIIPVKGRMNVEDISEDDRASIVHSPALSTQSPVPSLKESKDYFNSRSSPSDNKPANHSSINNGVDIEKLKSDYEYRLNTMTVRIKQLQDELDISRERKNSAASNDRELIENLKKKDDDIRTIEDKYKQLNEKYEDLNREYNQQQEAVRHVKSETKQMLEELKKLAKTNEDLLNEKEKHELEIERLKEEAKEWEKKYEKSRIEIRNIKSSSVLTSDPNHDLIKENFLHPTRDGIIPQDYIFTYQSYIDDLLNAARSADPSQVIHVMKIIVTVCRSMTEEVERQESKISASTKKALYELKTRFSTSLSDLLVATKYHASGMGLSPVSLLDRSASHLTAVIIELAKLLGLNSSPVPEPKESKSKTSSIHSSLNDEQYSRKPKKSSDNFSYYGSSLLNRKPSNPSQPENNYSSRKPSFNSYKNNHHDDYFLKNRQEKKPSLSPDNLVKHLKKETDTIVNTIQNLLSALRLPQQNGEAYSIIDELIKIISEISDFANNTCESTLGYLYKKECEEILVQLDDCSERISTIQTKYFSKGSVASAGAKRDLAKEAYEIARFTKELISLFES